MLGEGEGEASEDLEELASDEEYIEEIVPGTQMPALPKASTDYQDDLENTETSVFEGSQEFDYQGRTYMHVPQDLGINLRDTGDAPRNYIPKKTIHTWKSHTKAITSLRFFPNSGHLLLSSSADSKVKLFDVYHGEFLPAIMPTVANWKRAGAVAYL